MLFDLHNPEPAADLAEMSAHARRTDPQTSHDAARSITPGSCEQIRQRILEMLSRHDSLTHHAIYQKYVRLYGDHASESSIRTRCNELWRAGKIQDSGRRHVIEKTGREAILWELVP